MKHLIFLVSLLSILINNLSAQTTDPSAPENPVNLVMIHQSIGRGWLHTYHGDLGGELGRNNYFVSDVESQWNAPENSNVFGFTYPGAMYYWFVDSTVQGNGIARNDNIMNAVYNYFENWAREGKGWATYDTSLVSYPGGENTIVLFKPTHISSEVKDNNSAYDVNDLIGEPPYGKPPSDNSYTLENAKEMYKLYVSYFKAHPEKMFVLITPPPHMEATDAKNDQEAANARTLNTWLVNNWLQELNYENANVYVFDFFNVLTGPDCHHRVVGTEGNYSIEYTTGTYNYGYTEYYASPDNVHPEGGGGGDEGTKEFVPLLNVYYNRYQEWLGNLSGENPVVTTSQLKVVSVDKEYSDSLKASGGDGSYTWSVTGTLPEGITFSSAGILSGTVASGSEGSYNLSFTVTDGNSKTGKKTLELSVQGKLNITTTALNSALVGATYSSSVKAEGGTTPYSWFSISSLPSGLTLDAISGILSGTPEAEYADSIKIGVSDNGDPKEFDTVSLYLSIVDQGTSLYFREDSLPNGKVGLNYSTELNVVNGTAPFTFTHIAGDSLPNGVTMSASYFGGVPTEAGRFVFTIRLEDSSDPKEVYEKEISLTIDDSVDIINNMSSNALKKNYLNVTNNKGDITLKYNVNNFDLSNSYKMEICNLQGKVVGQIKLSNKNGTVLLRELTRENGALSAGVYLITLRNNDGIIVSERFNYYK